jgi:hypothetical protein
MKEFLDFSAEWNVGKICSPVCCSSAYAILNNVMINYFRNNDLF